MSNILLDTRNNVCKKCEFNDLSTVNSNIEKKVKNIEVIEKKEEEIVCIENNTTNEKVFQVFYKTFIHTFVYKYKKVIVRT